MITNKDIRVENGNLVLNGDKFPLDGQSPETIMEIVEDNSDTTPTENSTAPITSGGVFTALGTKQDTLTFDSAPTAESTNPVTSTGIKTAIDNKAKILNNIQSIDEDFEIPFIGCSDTANRVLCPISFPFSFATADYTLTCSKVELVGSGVYTTGITLSASYRSGALVILSTTSAAGYAYMGTATIHITRSAS